MARSTYCVSIPAWLLVPLMFQIFRGLSSLPVPSPSHVMSLRSMKLSVAPKSTRIFLLVIAREVQKETGIFILCKCILYTDQQHISRSALPQTVGFERFKNPAS